MACVISLCELLPNTYVRFANIYGEYYMSIRDIIMAFCGIDSHYAHKIWRTRLSDKCKNELLVFCRRWRFQGFNERIQDVITMQGALKLVARLPGNTAKEFRDKTNDILVRYMTGDCTLLKEIERNSLSTMPINNMALYLMSDSDQHSRYPNVPTTFTDGSCKYSRALMDDPESSKMNSSDETSDQHSRYPSIPTSCYQERMEDQGYSMNSSSDGTALIHFGTDMTPAEYDHQIEVFFARADVVKIYDKLDAIEASWMKADMEYFYETAASETNVIGYCYVIWNRLFTDLLKIGMTRRTPEIRIRELSGTGMPEPFEIVSILPCTNPVKMEREIHAHYASVRKYGRKKEFFMLGREEVTLYFRSLAVKAMQDPQGRRLDKKRTRKDLQSENNALRYELKQLQTLYDKAVPR